MGGTGVSKSQVSRVCEEIDARVKAFLDRPLEGRSPDHRYRRLGRVAREELEPRDEVRPDTEVRVRLRLHDASDGS